VTFALVVGWELDEETAVVEENTRMLILEEGNREPLSICQLDMVYARTKTRQ
jgi:hypothetical protein